MSTQQQYNLKPPTAISQLNYEDIVLELKQEILKHKPNIKFIESDDFSVMLEAFAYRELYLREKINQKIIKMLPHLSNGSDLDNFVLAFYGITRLENESDGRFFARAINSLNSYASAGSKQGYEFWTKSFSADIYDVLVTQDGPGIVKIYITSTTDIDIDKLTEFLNDDKIRPLTDKVEIALAKAQEIEINATITIYDLAQKPQINEQIQKNQQTNYKIGEDLIFSKLIKSLHVEGVYRVITNINKGIEINNHSIVKPKLNLTFLEKLENDI